ncbi:MAG: ABC transporter substrate-binding protein, partial [Kordiimonadaceae bacterium]|nr:ABC transporter substrate-binding protein [Kordiimonadaceae bacterium]
MKRRLFLKKSAAVGVGTLVTGACSQSPADPNSRSEKSAINTTQTQRSIELKMVTAWAKNFPGLGTRAVEFADDINKATNGRIKIRVYAAEEMVPAFQAFDAVSQG